MGSDGSGPRIDAEQVDVLVELAARSSNGMDVRLLWDQRQDTLSVQVVDWLMNEVFVIPVESSPPLEVFEHPFAYLPGGAAPELAVN